MTQDEEKQLVRRLEVLDQSVMIKALVNLVAGRVDVVMLPEGWRIQLAEPPREPKWSIKVRL